ncbi:A/G-specific adenine glycosylase [Ignatzschineria cameli]|uniref:A/G-specific adenine glycosylase n=1 Tax=Ignatzschineria cameli TaxID=2182793 RepID=UPI000D61414F|nr:A/G-specific adenine glycosylase [Ignatzschineria cameli]PWD86595.1 A/G-specific adenine glycosylase [Ignatzschineria cameli]
MTTIKSLIEDNTLLDPITEEKVSHFQTYLLEWFEREGRHDLPWKPQPHLSEKINLYRIWISEIMLQQTQVVTVLPYFDRFMTAFPTPEALAAAPEEAVLKLWQGLGYYTRARNLHAASLQLVTQFQGTIPPDFAAIRSLKGIGDTTANAILAQGFNLPYAILDGNVRRVLSRIVGMTAPRKELDKRLIPISELFLCRQNPADYTQAIMDFGATLCKLKPACERCFMREDCSAFQHKKVLEIPAKALKKSMPIESCAILIFEDDDHILLEKRPEKGIWGGLYSLPELMIKGRNARSKNSPLLSEITLDAIEKRENISHFRHQFTHYTLEASIFRAPLSSLLALSPHLKYALPPNVALIPKDEVLRLPKPKPIADLLTDYLQPLIPQIR